MASKRRVLKNKKKFLTCVTILLACCITLIFVSYAYGSKDISYSQIVVHTGDTLWSIASSSGQSNDIRKVIYDIKQLNHMDTSEIFEGQVLKLPKM